MKNKLVKKEIIELLDEYFSEYDTITYSDDCISKLSGFANDYFKKCMKNKVGYIYKRVSAIRKQSRRDGFNTVANRVDQIERNN